MLALVLALVVLVLAALVVGHGSAVYILCAPSTTAVPQLHFEEFQHFGGFLYQGRNSKFKFPEASQAEQAQQSSAHSPLPTNPSPNHSTHPYT